MEYILLFCSVVCAGLKSVFSKISNNCLDERNNIYTFNLFLFLTGGVIFLAIGWRDIFPLQWQTLLLAVLYACFTLSSQILLMQATKHGDVALTSMFYSSGFLVPIAFSAIVYHEAILLRQYIGMALLLISFGVGVKIQKNAADEGAVGKNNGVSLKWLIFAISALISAESSSRLTSSRRWRIASAPISAYLSSFFHPSCRPLLPLWYLSADSPLYLRYQALSSPPLQRAQHTQHSSFLALRILTSSSFLLTSSLFYYTPILVCCQDRVERGRGGDAFSSDLS